tara:strand:+ start:4215 stop:5348 length:1134 start_codon:yes stop_codon:yes gene_type:complete
MKVLVAGFFDIFHSGHLAFLEQASSFGDLYVSVGTDENLMSMKSKNPIYSEQEREYILNGLECVKEARISSGQIGSESFVPYMLEKKIDIFITNDDGSDLDNKKKICEKYGIEYIELKRVPKEGFATRSTTSISQIDQIPHRLDIVGFYDQTLLNSVYPGSVILANIETLSVDDRSGMSSSTRNVIRKVFGNRLPPHIDTKELAKIVFAVENPPGHKYISGVVDQLGLCLPGINVLTFDNDYWPYKIESILDKEICSWLSSVLFLKQTKPRPLGYNVFDGKESFDLEKVKHHSELGRECLDAIKKMNATVLGEVINSVHNSQKNMIPGYESSEVKSIINSVKDSHLGVKLMGAGGYGYMMIVSEDPHEDFIKISIRN